MKNDGEPRCICCFKEIPEGGNYFVYQDLWSYADTGERVDWWICERCDKTLSPYQRATLRMKGMELHLRALDAGKLQ